MNTEDKAINKAYAAARKHDELVDEHSRLEDSNEPTYTQAASRERKESTAFHRLIELHTALTKKQAARFSSLYKFNHGYSPI